MSKGKLSVRIPTVKLIKALSDKLKAMEKEFNEKEALKRKYEKAQKEWEKEVFNIAVKNADIVSVNVRSNYRNEITIGVNFRPKAFELPPEPEMPSNDVMKNYDYEHQKSEIENVLRILKMTEDETVNTSTYQAVSKYL